MIFRSGFEIKVRIKMIQIWKKKSNNRNNKNIKNLGKKHSKIEREISSKVLK